MSNSTIFTIKGQIVEITHTIASYQTHLERHGYSYSPLEIENKKVYLKNLSELQEHRMFQLNDQNCISCVSALDCIAKCDKII